MVIRDTMRVLDQDRWYLSRLPFTVSFLILFITGGLILWGQSIPPVFHIKSGYISLHPSTGSTRSTVLFDTCSQNVFIAMAGEVFQSSDSGKTWIALGSPLGSTPFFPRMAMNKCELWCSYENIINEVRFRIAVKKGTSWKAIADPAMPIWPRESVALALDSLIVVTYPDFSIGGGIIAISWDHGTLWEYHRYPGNVPISREECLFSPADGKLALTLRDSVVVEISSGDRTMKWGAAPQHTATYRYLDDQHLIAFLAKGMDSSSIALSSDGGRTWKETTVLTDVRTGISYHGVHDSLVARWNHVQDNGRCTVFFVNNMVASTTDYGQSWIVNGRFPAYWNIVSGDNNVAASRDGSIFFSANGFFYHLRSITDTAELVTTNAPHFASIVAIDSLNLVGQTLDACYYSSDGGQTWYVPSFKTFTTTFMSGGLESSYIERLAHVGDTLYLFNQRTGDVLFLHQGLIRFAYRAPLGYVTNNIQFQCSDGRYIVSGSLVGEFDGHTIRGFSDDGTGILEYSSKRYSPNVIRSPSTKLGAHYYTVTNAGDRYVFADSLFIRRSGTDQWISTVTGLPEEQGRCTSASSMVEAGQGALVCGFRGHSFRRNDSTIIQPGGIYTSADSGMNWTRSEHDLNYDPYVWQIVKSTKSLLFAIASRVSNASTAGTFYTTQSVVLRSINGGKDWQTVLGFEDFNHPANRSGQRLCIGGNGNVYALGVNEVRYTTDQGESWSVLANEFSPTGCLTDITVDASNRVWVASMDGVFMFSPTTGITGGDDHNRYTSVWLYPTPTSSMVTIRLNNLDLVDLAQCSLGIYDLYGNRCCDLTEALRSASTLRRYELPYNTGDLTSGLYVVVFQNQHGQTEQYKMLVVH